MRVQVPHDAQITGGLRAAGFSYPLCAHSPVFPVLTAAPPDLRTPRGLPARSPSAPRASLGASTRCPARPPRPRGSLQSGGDCTLTVPSHTHPPHTLEEARPAPANTQNRHFHARRANCFAPPHATAFLTCARQLVPSGGYANQPMRKLTRLMEDGQHRLAAARWVYVLLRRLTHGFDG